MNNYRLTFLHFLHAKRFNILFLSLIIASSVLIFYRLGSNSLHNGDEALYSIISYEMQANGDWITPHFRGEPYFNKPPLKFWLTAPAIRFFGTSEWVVRFWSAVSSVACVFFTVLLAKKLFGEAESLWAGLSLATCFQFVYEHCAKTGEMDAIFLFFLVSSLYFLVCSEETPRLLFVSAALMGLASLTKNFSGFLPFGIGVFYLLITGKWRNYTRTNAILAGLLFFAISASWMLVMINIHQRAFINEFFFRQVYNRAVSSEYGRGVLGAQNVSGGMLFVGTTIFKGFYPWSLILAPCMSWTVVQLKRWKKDNYTLPLLWFVGFGIALLFLKNKWHWYVLPIYPAASILVGRFITRVLSEKGIGWWKTVSFTCLFCGTFLVLPNHTYNLFALRAVNSVVSHLAFNPHPARAALFAVGSIVVWFFAAKGFPRFADRVALALLSLFAIVSCVLPLRYATHQAEIKMLTAKIGQETQTSGGTLYFYGIPKTVFESSNLLWHPAKIAKWYFSIIPRTRVSFLHNRQELRRQLQSDGKGLFLMPGESYQQIRDAYGHRVLARQTINKKTYILIGTEKE